MPDDAIYTFTCPQCQESFEYALPPEADLIRCKNTGQCGTRFPLATLHARDHQPTGRTTPRPELPRWWKPAGIPTPWHDRTPTGTTAPPQLVGGVKRLLAALYPDGPPPQREPPAPPGSSQGGAQALRPQGERPRAWSRVGRAPCGWPLGVCSQALRV